MAKYRKKPVVIEAEQFTEGMNRLPEGVLTRNDEHGMTEWYIPTLEGDHRVSDGDWIITGVEGERYPCKPGIFDKTHELVEGQ